MAAVRRLSEDHPKIVTRQPSTSKFRRQSVEVVKNWANTKQWWKYFPPFLLFLLLLARNFPASNNSTLIDPVAEVAFSISIWGKFFFFMVFVALGKSCQVLQLQKDWIAEEMKELSELNQVGRRSMESRHVLLTFLCLCVKGEKVGTRRVVVVSSWRSGSSLIGGLFDSHPGTSMTKTIKYKHRFGWEPPRCNCKLPSQLSGKICIMLTFLNLGMMYIYEPFQEYGAKIIR